MKKPLVIHPLLFAVFPILFLFSHNIGQMSIDEILFPAAISISSALLFWLVLYLFLKDGKRAGMIVSLLLFLFFSYGHFYKAILKSGIKFTAGGIVIKPHQLLIHAWIILFLIISYLVTKRLKYLSGMTSITNAVAIAMLVISLIPAGAYKLSQKRARQKLESYYHSQNAPVKLKEAEVLPDIYYIILDSYGNSNFLKEFLGFDNKEFLDFLTSKDFFIASESRSNYQATFLSLSSSLNMQYINFLSYFLGKESQDRTIPYHMIRENKVARLLKGLGYRFIHFRTRWGATRRNDYADLEIDCGGWSSFQNILIETTLLRLFKKGYFNYVREERNRLLCTFSELTKMPEREGPKFVFAHILSPHPPYLFGSTIKRPVQKMEILKGRKSRRKMKKSDDNMRYLNQLTYVNQRIEEIVDSILSNSKVPPIIILQSDHGARSIKFTVTGSRAERRKIRLKKKMSIFNAYYLPSGDRGLLYGSITPVNTFRLIFNSYFGTEYELLDDRSYYSFMKKSPYKFANVTETINDD